MGDTLSKPITEKHTSTFETALLRVGCCGMQGWRKNMEDAHVATVNLEGNKKDGFYGVFDGHNGQLIAKHCGEHLQTHVTNQESYKAKDYKTALHDAFLEIDQKLMNTPELRNEGGCTAVCCLIADGELFCANAGDSRAVLFRDNEAVALSDDHKPTLPDELARIQAAGGTVANNRVNGVLSLSRAIGDFDFKENTAVPFADQVITARPDVMSAGVLRPGDDFIVIACDGVWDVLSNEACCHLIQDLLDETDNDVGLVCEKVLDKCLAPAAPGIGCDNMTICIVQPREAYWTT